MLKKKKKVWKAILTINKRLSNRVQELDVGVYLYAHENFVNKRDLHWYVLSRSWNWLVCKIAIRTVVTAVKNMGVGYTVTIQTPILKSFFMYFWNIKNACTAGVYFAVCAWLVWHVVNKVCWSYLQVTITIEHAHNSDTDTATCTVVCARSQHGRVIYNSQH